MAPINNELKQKITKFIAENKIAIFTKTTCPFCIKVKKLFNEINATFVEWDLTTDKANGEEVQAILGEMTGQKTVPNVFIGGNHIGGCDNVVKLHSDRSLFQKINNHQYEYDLVVIGGGSGGLAASKEASVLGARVAVLDFVEPTPLGTSWGLGGTCVNVGCIPKKLMHQAALLNHYTEDARSFGWNIPHQLNHDWNKMVQEIQNHIGSLNWGYRTALRTKGVTYKNAYGSFKDKHTLQLRDRSGNVTEITSHRFIVATGERPRYLGIPGDREYCITSDDLFSLPYCPGKTLVIGASYVALECAGFITGLGLSATVMVRSILLRGFDQQISEMIGDYMQRHGTKFIRPCVPTKIVCIKGKGEDGTPGLYEVTGKMDSGEEFVDTFNTIIVAVGRDPCTRTIGLDKINMSLDKDGRVKCDDKDQTNVDNIYAIGDIVSGRPQLTPVAIQAGRLLAKRLYSNSKELTDYVNVPTTVFTPLEYGCIGLSEEDALKKYGQEKIEVFHSYFKPLEWTVAHREDNACYAKLVVNSADNNRVVGFHVLGPNAGEITQGFGIAIKMGATKYDFDRTIGIHPTCAETFTTLSVTKRSGVDASASGC